MINNKKYNDTREIKTIETIKLLLVLNFKEVSKN